MPAEIPKARAVVFDLDGTLLDTLGDLADGVNVALQANGFPTHSEQTICGFIGDGAEMLIKRALPDLAKEDERQLAACLASFQEHYGEHYANRTKPYDGVFSMLETLKGRGIPLAILSNKPHAFTLQCAETYFGDTFAVVFGQRDGIPKKPDPAGAIEAAQRLGVPPGECLYVGDSDVDMRTARAAGMVAIGVSWGFRTAEELREEGAVVVIDSPAEVISAFA